MENIEKSALANDSIVKLFTNDKLSRTFSTNEEAISYMKNLSFKTNGVYEQEGDTITVTTPKDNVHKLKLLTIETGTFVVSTPNENHFFVTLKEAKQDFEDGVYEMKKLKISGEIILFQLPTIPDFDEREMYEYLEECLLKSLEEIILKEEI